MGNEIILSKQGTDKEKPRQHAMAPQTSNKRGRLHVQRSKRYAVIGLTTGILCGFLLCLWSRPIVQCTIHSCCLDKHRSAELHEEPKEMKESVEATDKHKKRVLVGVMTASQFLDNRALAAWRTWAQTLNGDIIFFSSENSSSSSSLPLVALPGVTDAYPPQKKSFMMLKYLHDFGGNRYEFFMRVDDDLYIHGERLDSFLSTLNPSDTLYIGQAGTGNAEELGRLALGPDENFCMGGPGVIFSGVTLKKVIPHMGYCLQNLLTSHEDVEVGRCVHMFAGTSCTWSYEMQKLFFHSYTYRVDSRVFPHVMNGPELDNSITLHPVKDPAIMYQLHNEMAKRSKAKLGITKRVLEKEIADINLSKGKPEEAEEKKGVKHVSKDETPWTFLTARTQYAHNMFSLKRNHEGAWKELLNMSLNYVLAHYNRDSLAKGWLLGHPEVVYGFRRFHPIDGIQLKLKLKLSHQKIKGKLLKTQVSKFIHLQIPLGASEIRERTIDKDMIHFILPLFGKFFEFIRFLKQFEKICISNRRCDLTIVLFQSSEYNRTIHTIKRYQHHNLITVVDGRSNFSRAMALHQGVLTKKDTDLLLFIDVDIYFDQTALNRVRQHTVIGAQLYFPIVFNQYDSQMVCHADACSVENQTPEAGSYRFFGFGIVSLYKIDYITCGGFDLGIHGWGKEDVDLYTKVLKSTLKAFRAADPGLTHIYHAKVCDATLGEDQTNMCLNSKATSFASQATLAQLYFNDTLRKHL